MRPSGIVELNVAADRGTSLGHRLIGFEIHLLVFDRTPKPLHEDIVAPGAFAVHADFDAALEKNIRERRAGELAALDALLFVKRQFAWR